MTKGRLILIAAIAAFAAFLVAFGPAPETNDKNTLRVTMLSTPDSIDPAITYASESWSILPNIYDPLLTYKRAGGAAGNELIPDVAEAMPTISPDGRTYTFKVRKGIKFAPPVNRELVASDVEYTINRLALIGTQGNNFFNPIEGFKEVYAAKKGKVKGVTSDDKTGIVTFHLVQRDATFLYSVASNFSSIVPKGTPIRDLSQGGFVPGTGPYMFDRYTPGSRLTLKRNPNYKPWTKDLPTGHVDKIDITIGVSDDNATTWLIQGKSDLAFNKIPRSKWGFLKNSDKYKQYLHVDEASSTSFIWLNSKIAPFNNVKARQAVNWAVDRRAVVKLGGGASKATSNILPPLMPGAPKTQAYPEPDVAKAKQLVEESGTKGQSVTLWYETSPSTKDLAQYLQNVLAGLGYDASTRPIDRSSYSSIVGDPKTKAQMGLAAWGADYPEAYNFISIVAYGAGKSPYNYGHIDMRDKEIEAIHKLADLDQRASEWGKLDTLMMTKDAPMVPLSNTVNRSLVGERVGDYISHPVMDTILAAVTIDGSGTNNSKQHDGELNLDGSERGPDTEGDAS